MTDWLVPIIVALVAGGPLVWLLDHRNSKQHAKGVDLLERLDGKVDRLDGKVDRLDQALTDHLKGPKK